jgi:hypothetical protein
MLEADHTEGHEVEAQLRAIQHRVITLDYTGLFELANAAKARRRRYPYPVGKLHIRHATVCLQLTQYLYIDGVKFGADQAGCLSLNCTSQLLYNAAQYARMFRGDGGILHIRLECLVGNARLPLNKSIGRS